MTTVFIKNLVFKTIIGLLKSERKQKQKIEVNIELRADEFIDYAVVVKYTKSKFKKMRFKKVEDALEYFSVDFKENFPSLNYFYMDISKTKIIRNAIVGARIERIY